MAIQTNMSIVSFLKELKTRIELLSSNKITENINNSNIDKINDILSHYNISPNKEISFYEISLISEDDIVSLLSLVGQTANSIKYILNELDEYYERIAAIINKYIRDFISIGATQTQMLNDKITLYKKYIDLFEQDNFKEPFSDINEISRVMSEVGLPDEDKWKILAYVACANNQTVADTDINLGVLIDQESQHIESYLNDSKISEIIKNRLEKEVVDIDTIPTLAEELALDTNLEKDVLINIISVIVASNLFIRFENSGNKEDKEELKELIKLILENIVPLKNPAIYEAEIIKRQKIEFYFNSLENGVNEADLKTYVDLSISEIEEKTLSREYAIDLKELAVLKPIFETLNTLESLEYNSPEYQKAINILKKLNEQYRILEEKKVANLK